MKGVLAIVLLLGACSDARDKPHIQRDRAERPRRIIEPPSGIVRSLPPHAIRAEGVGPYRLGERLDTLLEQLPGGPRIALFDIPNFVHRSLIRAEDDTVLIGGAEPSGTASFVAVIGPEVARTESGIHVGVAREDLDHALGPIVEDLDRARDPRVLIGEHLRNLSVILDGKRARALVVTANARPVIPPDPTACIRPARTDRAFGACMTATGIGSAAPPTGELVEVTGDDVVISSLDGVRLAVLHLPTLVFAAPLRNPVDGRDELVAIMRSDEPNARTWSLVAYRLDGKLVRTIEPTMIYQLSSANVRWIGGELRDVEIYAELIARPDAIETGGLLTIENGGKLRYVMTISSSVVPRRHAKTLPLPVESGAGGGRDADVPDDSSAIGSG
ncbi:MAG: hypothetical protein NT062_15580 [Proteobacteria bacterium]|nr:hypothetical protein [Pseudomonadota bacterium]